MEKERGISFVCELKTNGGLDARERERNLRNQEKRSSGRRGRKDAVPSSRGAGLEGCERGARYPAWKETDFLFQRGKNMTFVPLGGGEPRIRAKREKKSARFLLVGKRRNSVESPPTKRSVDHNSQRGGTCRFFLQDLAWMPFPGGSMSFSEKKIWGNVREGENRTVTKIILEKSRGRKTGKKGGPTSYLLRKKIRAELIRERRP